MTEKLVEQRDYNICPDREDGKHHLDKYVADPIRVEDDGRLLIDVACRYCGVTTGILVGPASDLEWN